MSIAGDRTNSIMRAFDDHVALANAVALMGSAIERVADAMCVSLRSGGKILWCGNGGSAADSQHLSAELVGRFRRERPAIASLALSTNTSSMTAIANDYSYQHVFSRQVEAFGRSGDLIVGISTSGNSANVVAALTTARNLGVTTVAFTGEGGGRMAQTADHILAVPSTDTARIQEMHILIGHIICDYIEEDWVRRDSGGRVIDEVAKL